MTVTEQFIDEINKNSYYNGGDHEEYVIATKDARDILQRFEVALLNMLRNDVTLLHIKGFKNEDTSDNGSR